MQLSVYVSTLTDNKKNMSEKAKKADIWLIHTFVARQTELIEEGAISSRANNYQKHVSLIVPIHTQCNFSISS